MAISLVAVHGNGGGGERFDLIRPHLPTDIVLTSPTLPGFGGTPADPAITQMAGYSMVLADLVADLPHPRIALGTGIGGSHVLELLRHNADALDGVILHAPVGPRLDTRLFPRLLRRPLLAGAARRIIASRLFRPLIAGHFFADQTPSGRTDAVLDAYADCAVFAQQFQIIDGRWWRSLPARELPSVILWGADERVLDADMAAEVVEKLPRATVETVAGWDHFPMIDHPAEYAEVITRLTRDLVDADT